MSFYLGTDNSNNKVMHITKGANTVAQLKSGVLPNTVFHSSLPYVVYKVYPAEISASTIKPPAAFFTDILTHKKLYFVIYKKNGEWEQLLVPSVNAPSNIVWWTNPSGGTSSFYPSTTHPWAKLGGTWYDLTGYEAYSFVTINLAQTGYLPVTTYGNEITVKNGDILTNGLDLHDLFYINANPINNFDLKFKTNEGHFQLINSDNTTSGGLNIVSNQTATTIYNGEKVIFTTSVDRAKVFFDAILTGTLPYGSVTTSSSGTWDRVIFGSATFSVGDMFFIKYYADGNTGNDFETSSNFMLRFKIGHIATYSENKTINYVVSNSYYGNSDGSLSLRIFIHLASSGTLVSKRFDFTLYKLK